MLQGSRPGAGVVTALSRAARAYGSNERASEQEREREGTREKINGGSPSVLTGGVGARLSVKTREGGS